jgi:hypothetical protein
VIRKNISCHWKNKLIHFAEHHLENMEMSGKTSTQPKLLDKVRNEMRAWHRGILYWLDKEVYSLEYKKAINSVVVKKDIK